MYIHSLMRLSTRKESCSDSKLFVLFDGKCAYLSGTWRNNQVWAEYWHRISGSTQGRPEFEDCFFLGDQGLFGEI